MTNHFDKNGNYINCENLSLAEIYKRGAAEGYKKGYADASLEWSARENRDLKDISERVDDLYSKLVGGGV